MEKDGLGVTPHRRLNLLTGEWLLVSPQRTKRPWSGQVEAADHSASPQHDPSCYLCPGNQRAEGATNPDYTDTYVFTNDFSALLPEVPTSQVQFQDSLLRAEPESGICRVICYSPRHDLTIARMSQLQIEKVIATWIAEFTSLGAKEDIDHVQIFENRGLMMGCSNPHPHGQVWANLTIPTLPAAESVQQQKFIQEKKCCLLCTYLERELKEQSRILFSNNSFVALVPFWAIWPFETMVLPRRHLASIDQLTSTEQRDLAVIIKKLGTCYDNLFQTSFPYSMGIHQQPTDGRKHPWWHFHLHYFPPLLRSKSVKKHMVGYELLAMPQRDLTAEMAADRLKEQDHIHYLERGR